MTNTSPISQEIRKRRWRWTGHVLRMPPDANARVALRWTPPGKRKRGIPNETWRRSMERERDERGRMDMGTSTTLVPR